jgi:hypothetical protein
VPTESNDIKIDGFIVTLNGNCFAKNITISNGGTILFEQGSNLKTNYIP